MEELQLEACLTVNFSCRIFHTGHGYSVACCHLPERVVWVSGVSVPPADKWAILILSRFVKKKHSEENAVREENLEEEVDFITFHSLIKVGQNRRIVAAQAFHHTLLLATKGLITVSQESPFGTIQMSVNNP